MILNLAIYSSLCHIEMILCIKKKASAYFTANNIHTSLSTCLFLLIRGQIKQRTRNLNCTADP